MGCNKNSQWDSTDWTTLKVMVLDIFHVFSNMCSMNSFYKTILQTQCLYGLLLFLIKSTCWGSFLNCKMYVFFCSLLLWNVWIVFGLQVVFALDFLCYQLDPFNVFSLSTFICSPAPPIWCSSLKQTATLTVAYWDWDATLMCSGILVTGTAFTY